MIIEIKGIQFYNKGAQLMLQAIIEQLHAKIPDTIIALETKVLSPYLLRAQVGALQKISLHFKWVDLNFLTRFIPKKIRNLLMTLYGIVTEADIDTVLDASGFAYGNKWPIKNLFLVANRIHRMQKTKTPYIFLPQAFGPFNSFIEKKLACNALTKASLVCVRDSVSLNHIQKLIVGKKESIVSYPDFTCLVKGYLPENFNLSRYIAFVPNINMLNKTNIQQGKHPKYISCIINLMEESYKLGFDPILINHDFKLDSQLINQISKMLSFKPTVITEKNPILLKGILGYADLVVSSRYHACISALSQNVPCIGTSWSHKYEELFADFRCTDSLIKKIDDFEKNHEIFLNTLKNKNEISKKLSQQTKIYREQTSSMWNKIFSCFEIENSKLL